VAWLAVLALTLVGGAGAQVRKTLRLDSVPPGAQVYLSVAGERKPLGSTPLDYEAEFHSEMSVQSLRFERAGYTPADLEITPARNRVVATLVETSVFAAAATQADSGLRALQERIAPALGGAIRQALAAKSAEGVQLDGTVRLRRVGGAPYLEVPLALPHAVKPSDLAGESARRLWRELGGDLATRVRRALPPASGLAGLVVLGRLDTGASSFTVGSSAESKTEIACLPGMRSVYDSCATMQSTYETYCNPSGQCFQRNTGSRCAAGTKSVFDACATKGPVTKYAVRVEPRTTIQAAQARVVALLDFAATDKPVRLAEFDDQGRAVFRDGKLPAELEPAAPAPRAPTSNAAAR
jgi:hypothetical protein